MIGVRLSGVCAGRDNNLNLIRMVAAASVLVSHAYPISLGRGAGEPLEELLGRSLGAVAVTVFFVISGFLITRSFDRGQSFAHWAQSRFLRLFPGLFVVLALTTLCLGPSVTDLSLGAYATDPATLAYIPRNLTLAFLQYDLPGVFRTNPYGAEINGSLWSLFYEVLCYAGVAVAGLAGLFVRPRLLLAVVAAYAAAYLMTAPELYGAQLPGRATVFRDLSLPFLLGSVAYVWRERVILSGPILAVGALVLTALRPTPFFDAALTLWISYAALFLAYRPGGPLRAYNRLGDYSYGIYIYAFPCQQLAVHLFGPMQPFTNMLLAAPVILLCAMLSWRFIEAPALRLARKASPAPRTT
ncbi:MAG: acyltransferase family protein [Albidovulum sp.]